jgi:hypothetical protein
VLNDEEKSESTKSDLDDMWYTGDKESNIQDFEDEDLVDNEDFKEMNAYIIDGLHVPHDEMEGMQKGNKETPSLVEIDSPSMPLDEPNITLVEKSSKDKVLLTQNVHLAPSTQQAQQTGFTRAENHKTCQSIFPEN